jgi:hypothetical protein
VIFLDILVYLAVAKIAVLLLEDAAYAVRGKQSPRRQARARQQAAAQKAGDGSAGPAGPGRAGGTVAAADGYLAGLIEDATDRARARRRRAAARKRGAQAVDGVVVDVDEQGRWYADCDLCDWHSRPYRIEANASGAGRDHTRTAHPDQYTGQPEPEPAAGDSAESAAPTTTGDAGGGGEEEPRRPALRVIPGGAVPDRPGEPVGDPDPDGPSTVVHTDQHPYCLTPCGPTCTAPLPRPRYGWRCRVCGQRDESFTSMEAAQEAGGRHTCPKPAPEPATSTVPGPTQTSGSDAGDDQHHPAADPAAGTSSTTEQLRELTVNLEATGPEEIRAAFTAAAEAAGENSETISGIAGVMTEAADRYESLEMAASTVGHLRDAAEQFAAAAAALNTAQEELQAALGDFNSKDGQVAEAVADAGGNVASKEVLVG